MSGVDASDVDALRCMRICSPGMYGLIYTYKYNCIHIQMYYIMHILHNVYTGDQVVLSTQKGTIIRQNVDDLSIQSRTATGTILTHMSVTIHRYCHC